MVMLKEQSHYQLGYSMRSMMMIRSRKGGINPQMFYVVPVLLMLPILFFICTCRNVYTNAFQHVHNRKSHLP